VLHSVRVRTAGNVIRLVVREGTGTRDVACPEYAQLKAVRVDLGRPAPGDYVVVAGGRRAPLSIS
jgi:hypothetical protein